MKKNPPKGTFKFYLTPDGPDFHPAKDCIFLIDGKQTRDFMTIFKGKAWLVYLMNVKDGATLEIKKNDKPFKFSELVDRPDPSGGL